MYIKPELQQEKETYTNYFLVSSNVEKNIGYVEIVLGGEAYVIK